MVEVTQEDREAAANYLAVTGVDKEAPRVEIFLDD